MKRLNYSEWVKRQYEFSEPCKLCIGTGIFNKDDCPNCDGHGIMGVMEADYKRQLQIDDMLLKRWLDNLVLTDEKI